MKRFIGGCVLMQTFAAGMLSAATLVQGTLQGVSVFTAEQSPYRVQGTVLVPRGAALKVMPGARLEFAPSAGLHVKGNLQVEGRAAYPVEFDFSKGDNLSFLFGDGAEISLKNAKFNGGRWVFSSTRLSVSGCEFTRGSGLVLLSGTHLEASGNKLYGNATGVLVMEPNVTGSFRFNTVAGNTHGLDLRADSAVTWTDNSIRDNQWQVSAAQGVTAKIGGNAWGSLKESEVLDRCRGKVIVQPLRSLDDLLRKYLKTQLPKLSEEALQRALEKAKAEKERKKKKPKPAALEPKAPAKPSAVKTKEKTEQKLESPKKLAPPAKGGETLDLGIRPLPSAPHMLPVGPALPPEQPLPGEIPATSGKGAAVLTPAPARKEEPRPMEEEAPPAEAPSTGGEGLLDLPPPDFGEEWETQPETEKTKQVIVGEPKPGTPAPSPAEPLRSLDTELPDFDFDFGDETAPAEKQAPVKEPEKTAPPAVPAESGAAEEPIDLPDFNFEEESSTGAAETPQAVEEPKKKTPSSGKEETLAPELQKPPAGADLPSDMELPPLSEEETTPPSDLDLPPVDDLGDLELDL